MNVYRIEHEKKKIGPYCGGAIFKTSDPYRYYNSDCAPDPGQDGLGWMGRKEYSGFVSIYQMVSWFRIRDIFKMRRHGYRVYKFKVNRRVVRTGGKQVCFARHTSWKKEEVRLRQLAWHRARSVFGV